VPLWDNARVGISFTQFNGDRALACIRKLARVRFNHFETQFVKQLEREKDHQQGYIIKQVQDRSASFAGSIYGDKIGLLAKLSFRRTWARGSMRRFFIPIPTSQKIRVNKYQFNNGELKMNSF
jgi:hypothetical protein